MTIAANANLLDPNPDVTLSELEKHFRVQPDYRPDLIEIVRGCGALVNEVEINGTWHRKIARDVIRAKESEIRSALDAAKAKRVERCGQALHQARTEAGKKGGRLSTTIYTRLDEMDAKIDKLLKAFSID